MKKYKNHLLSIMIIVFMIVFALGTSAGTVYIELMVINNSSSNLKIKISIEDYKQDERYHTEECILNIGENKSISITGHNSHTPSMYISEIFIFNEDGETIKEFRSYDNNYETVYSLNINYDRRERNSKYYYTWEITNELLK